MTLDLVTVPTYENPAPCIFMAYDRIVPKPKPSQLSQSPLIPGHLGQTLVGDMTFQWRIRGCGVWEGWSPPPPLELVPILKTYAKCRPPTWPGPITPPPLECGWRHTGNVQGGAACECPRVAGADTGCFGVLGPPPPPPRLSAIFFLYSNPQMLIFPCPLNFIVVFSLPN